MPEPTTDPAALYREEIARRKALGLRVLAPRTPRKVKPVRVRNYAPRPNRKKAA